MVRALHIAWKDVRIWVRDIAALGILVGMPIVLIVILGSALGGDGVETRIKVAIVDRDTGHGAEFAELIESSERLEEVFEIERVTSARAAEDRVAQGEYAAALIIPEGFSASMDSGRPVELEVLSDPGQELSAGIFAGVIRSFAVRYSSISVSVRTLLTAAAEAQGESVLADPATVGRLQGVAVARASADDALTSVGVKSIKAADAPEFRALDYYALSMSAMFLMFGAMFGAFSLIRERREQTLARLLSTPTGSLSVTGGKMLGVFLLGLVQFSVLFAFTRFVLKVDWGADLGAVFLIAGAELIAVTGLAMVIGALAKSERGAGGIGPLVIQIQALIGGSFFPVSILPEWLQPIRYASVVGWAMEGWDTIRIDGGGIPEIRTPVLALFAFAGVFFVLASVLTGRRR